MKKFIANPEKVDGSLIVGLGQLVSDSPVYLDETDSQVQLCIARKLLIPYVASQKPNPPVHTPTILPLETKEAHEASEKPTINKETAPPGPDKTTPASMSLKTKGANESDSGKTPPPKFTKKGRKPNSKKK